ncbi:hypothetical protein HK101_009154 [Irineochytrium annulatum]|nr:hypothetical protein HK101_009154 [Irineochytrium annulatum]
MRILIVDNYDSYTFNLLQACELNTVASGPSSSPAPVVIRNDQVTEWNVFESTILPHFDCIIISPGPGRPDHAEDFGICSAILARSPIPVLGVCLGHQGLAVAFDGSVVRAKTVVHGRLSPVTHAGVGLFAGIPSPFNVVRYHSLVVDPESVREEFLKITAWTTEEDGNKVVMGMEHVERPLWSVQFHPESICTEFGQRVVDNFLNLAALYHTRHPNLNGSSVAGIPPHIRSLTVVPQPLIDHQSATQRHGASLRVRIVQLAHGFRNSEQVFETLYRGEPARFWLDSARVEEGRSRFSFMGCAGGPLSMLCAYSVESRVVTTQIYGPERETSTRQLERGETFFHWISRQLHDRHVDASAVINYSLAPCTAAAGIQLSGPPLVRLPSSTPPLDFDFLGGFVGFFGYEMRVECLVGEDGDGDAFTHAERPIAPDSSFIFADRVVVFDHQDERVHLVALERVADGNGGDDAVSVDTERWIQETAGVIASLPPYDEGGAGPCGSHRSTSGGAGADASWRGRRSNSGASAFLPPTPSPTPSPRAAPFTAFGNDAGCDSDDGEDAVADDGKAAGPCPRNGVLTILHPRGAYVSSVVESLRQIEAGETYEVCLTTRIRGRVAAGFRRQSGGSLVDSDHALKAYSHLRRRNAAPFATFYEFPALGDDVGVGAFSVIGSSPERFLRVRGDGMVEMKPIKGTVARPALGLGRRDGWEEDEEERKVGDEVGDEERERWRVMWEEEDERRKVMLETNEKDRSENLMIVDLIRNDLNLISEKCTVTVPHLMHVETYSTIHQLVTTVRSHLRPGLTCVDAIRATFPPGSMTGAPKRRTVGILNGLEGEGVARGVYSGCSGFLSVTGAADLSVVIRTAVIGEDGRVEVGAGGAIVYLSNPVGEYEEMVLKADSVVPSLEACYGFTRDF